MKISKETRVGALVAIGIILLIVGFNFLKGKTLFSDEIKMYAMYNDVMGLKVSNPVIISGMQVGKIAAMDGGKDMKKIVVSVVLTKDVNIPVNSLAMINPNLLGSVSLEIKLGNADQYLQDGDTLLTTLSTGALEEAMKVINPVLYEVSNAVESLDSVLNIVTGVFDQNTKNNVKRIIANLASISQSFAASAQSLETMMDVQNGMLAMSMQNIESFTGNLEQNNAAFDSIIQNTKETTAELAALNLESIMNSLKESMENFEEASEKFNSKEGTLGLLLNDKQLYQNLESTSRKLSILIDDIRTHPKRYVNISIFGKEDRGNYLTAPLIDDTLKIVYPE